MLPRLRKSKLTPEEIKTQYVVGLKTMEEIGIAAGISKQAVRHALNAMGVEYRGGKVKQTCAYCGGEFMARRKMVSHGRSNHCSLQCYNANRSLGGDMSVSSRMGRAALAQEGVKLQPGNVVHHIDGDRKNNDPSNLMIFASQREHMRHHHALRNRQG